MKKLKNILTGYKDVKNKKFKFFAFWSPEITQEQYAEVKACGYTHLIIDAKYGAEYGTPRLGEAIELARVNGLKAVVMGGGENGNIFVNKEHPYINNEALEGPYVDEPLSLGDLEKISKEIDIFNAKYPNKKFYVNLVCLNGKSWEVYSEYFKQQVLSKLKYRTVSGDIYPLREGRNNGKTLCDFLDYIRRVGVVAKDTKSEFFFFVQTISMHGNGWGNPARHPSYEDIRFLSYSILSCGAKGFQHFCYMAPGQPPFGGEFTEKDDGCLNHMGEKTDIWYSAQKVISEFKKFENIFLQFEWKGVMPVYGSEERETCENFDNLGEIVYKHSYIEKVKAKRNLLIGCFEDQDKNVGFTILNFNDPYQKHKNELEISFVNQKEIILIKNGENNIVKLNDGNYQTTLEAGEGQFIILAKNTEEAQLKIFVKKEAPLAYLYPPKNVLWKEKFIDEKSKVYTYNEYGTGKSVFRFLNENYPKGGSGKVLCLETSTQEDKDWSAYRLKIPKMKYDPTKKIVIKMYFTKSCFSLSVKFDHMIKEAGVCDFNTLERVDRWTYVEVPMNSLYYNGLEEVSEITLCVGAGIPYGTLAYIDEYMITG